MKNYFLFFNLLIFTFISCEKVPNNGIPSYIKLRNTIVLPDSPTQGSSKNQFSDLWIETNGVSLGAYELPVTFAALLNGETEIVINPGVKMNGDYTNRRAYPIFEPFKAKYTFSPEDTIEITPIFRYRKGVEFVYIEDFESTNNFDNLLRTEILDVVNYEGKSGVLTLFKDEIQKNATTISSININKGKRVYVELTLKSESYVGVGFKSINNSSKFIDIAVFKPSNKWVTTYFELTSFINSVNEGSYNFYINAQKNTTGAIEKTYFDNLRIIQF